MTEPPVISRKKLIEVALPLEAINKESLRRKQKAPKGWPTSFHKWWAQRPLAAARAVIFAQMVDDPSTYVDTLLGVPETRRAAERELKRRRGLWVKRKAEHEAATGNEAVAVPEPGPEPTLEDCVADIERQRLFRIIEELVLWENTTNETVLEKARAEIWQSWRRACADNAGHPRAKELFSRSRLPPLLDPFSGSGSIPLAAQWLGIEVRASDLNPVAVIIARALIEVPPKFDNQPPVSLDAEKDPDLVGRQWKGAQGLAEDVRYYGKWMRDEAERRIGHLYPKVDITAEVAKERPDLKPLVGRKLTTIAWIWARTVKSPNPAFRDVDVPLASTFILSSKSGKEAYVEPLIEGNGYRFVVRIGKPKDPATSAGTKLGRGANFRCIMSGSPIEPGHVYTEAKDGRMGARLLAIVAEGDRGRVYLSPSEVHEVVAGEAQPKWSPDVPMPDNPRWFSPPLYGIMTFGDLFTRRQLVALNTLSDLVQEAREKAKKDAISAGLANDGKSLAAGGLGASAYGDAMALYMACVVDRVAYYGSTLAAWLPKDNAIRDSMPRQAIAMSWDFAEGNPFGKSSVEVTTCSMAVSNYLDVATPLASALVLQADAANVPVRGEVVSTDPPYYDNIGYADLSDFFYLWLRRSLQKVFPDLFTTVAVPKTDELVATPHRHGGEDEAEAFFLRGMTKVMRRLADGSHPAFPTTIYYAFKQSETSVDGTASTGWETFLEAVIQAGFAVTGTLPMRTEGASRILASGTNALASSIVLVCRRRSSAATLATRREFAMALAAELPSAISELQRGNIAPVDLAQAAIGPGMAVFMRYTKVVDAQGRPLTVRDALALINEVLDEVLAKQEGDFDTDTRWALTWFEDVGFVEGDYGRAEQLSKSKNTSVSGMVDAGILQSGRGKARLLRPDELPGSWDPATDTRLTVWEMVHHLIRVFEADGEAAAATLLAKIGAAKAEVARELAYRLFTISERKKRSADALSYNGLVQAWPEISRLARASAAEAAPEQAALEL